MKSKLKHIISGFAVGVMILSNVFSPIVTAYDAHDASTSFVMPDRNVTLKARSQANNYTIMFRPNGGTGSMSGMNMTYGSGRNLTLNSFTRTGYTFRGWSTGEDINTLAYQDGANVSNLATTGIVNLYALWSANKYYVSFSGNQGSDTLNPVVGTMPTQTFTYNQTQQLTGNKYVRTGYTFSGWSLTSQGDVDYADGATGRNMTTESGNTVTLYAIWTADTGVEYKVNHYLMDTEGNYPSLGNPTYTDAYSGTTYELVEGKTGNYQGFSLSGSAQQKRIKGDGTTVFNYYYVRNQYTVTLHEGRGVQSVEGAGNYYYSGDVNLSATLKQGYTGLTWTGTKTTSGFKMPANNVNMTASATPINYKITVDVGSGTMASGNVISYNVEAVASGFVLSDPTRTGYDFEGWTGAGASKLTGSTETGWQLKAGTIGDFELEAVWTPRSNVEYKVYHMHENLSGEYEEISVVTYTGGTADATLTLANLKNDVDGDCVTYTGGSLTMSTGSLPSLVTTTTVLPDGSRKVYLYYTRNSYTVTLEKDDGIDSVSPVSYTYKCGEIVGINATPKTGYTFKVWEVEDPTSGWTPTGP